MSIDETFEEHRIEVAKALGMQAEQDEEEKYKMQIDYLNFRKDYNFLTEYHPEPSMVEVALQEYFLQFKYKPYDDEYRGIEQ